LITKIKTSWPQIKNWPIQLASDEIMAEQQKHHRVISTKSSKDKNVHQFIGQRLYKSLHNGKLSKRAQEVTGIPLINFNLPQTQKEPLKRTFSACTPADGSHMNSSLSWHWSPNSTTSNFQPLESMPEMPQNNQTISGSKPLLSETLSMPLLPNYFSVENTDKYENHHIQNTAGPAAALEEQIQVESGDEERLLPTDLLNDPDDDCINDNQNLQKPILRKTWSWTPVKDPLKSQEELHKKKTPEGATIRHLERAIKSLSIDPNVSISRKF